MRRVTTLARAAALRAAPLRGLSLLECDGRKIMREYGRGHLFTVEVGSVFEVANACAQVRAVSSKEGFIVKSQVLAGGRGKGVFKDGYRGGVKLAKTVAEAQEIAGHMLGNTIVTAQTGPAGAVVRKVSICEVVSIVSEHYVAIILDRGTRGPLLVAAKEGGVNIEELARTHPEQIHKLPIDISRGLVPRDAAAFAKRVFGMDDEVAMATGADLAGIYRMAVDCDMTQIEINPFCVTGGKPARVLCLDAKVSVDDSADFRQPAVFAMRDVASVDPREAAAADVGLSYIALDGSVGCLVNGAGLAMATCDTITQKGGSAANFLDVGGGASEKTVTRAFSIIEQDPKVRSVLVNIFGGIMRCDVIAQGIISAATKTGLKHPLVVRLAGSYHTEGLELLRVSGIDVRTADTLDEAASLAVELAQRTP